MKLKQFATLLYCGFPFFTARGIKLLPSHWFAVWMQPWIAVLLTMITCFPVMSQTREPSMTLPLWADGAPDAVGSDIKDKPQAIIYLLETKSEKPTSALIIFPGGGYGNLAMDHEGKQIADWANTLGMVAIICDYRHRNKGYGHPAPMQDAQRAIRLARAKASEWNIDPEKVGVMGFSAGGHLASTVLTHFDAGDATAPKDSIARQISRPNFGILCYPVIGLGKPYTHTGSQRNLLGANASAELIASLSNEDQVSSQTPPTFLWHTQEDQGVSPENSIQFYAAMVRNKVKGELHVFEKGRHGVGLAMNIPGTKEWSIMCANWLRNQSLVP